MRSFLYFIAGSITAAALLWITVAAKQFYHVVDHGVTVTHMGDEMQWLQNESDMLRDFALSQTAGMSRQSVIDTLDDYGWDWFDKPDEHAIYASPKGSSGQIGFIFENNRLNWITNHCERFHSDEVCRPTLD